MSPETTTRRAVVAAASAAALLYSAFPSALYNFDGVACAIAVELGDFRHLAHGNHLLYGILGYAWFSLWKICGYSGPALLSLQTLDSLLAAAAVGVFVRWAIRCGVRPISAMLAAVGLMVSVLYWTWALEAQVYLLGCLFLLLAAEEAARDYPRPVRMAAWHAAAVLGHVGHVMFFPAGWWLLSGADSEKSRADRGAFRTYAGTWIGTLTAAYAAAMVLFIRPGSPQDVRAWLLGSAALTVDRRFQWVGGIPFQGIVPWARTSLEIFGGGPWVGAALWLAAAAGAAAAWRRRKRWIVAALIWLGGYAILFTAWHPGQSVYRVSDLAAAWLLIALGAEETAERSPRRARALFATWGLAVASLAAVNFFKAIKPAGDPGLNADLQRALWIGRSTPDNAWVIVDQIDQVYVPYFGHRKPLNLRYYADSPERMQARVQALTASGEPVFAVLGVLPPEWLAWLRTRNLREAARRGGDVLYLVK